MGETIGHGVIKGKNDTQVANTLVLPKGYEILGEVDIEKIKIALETYADGVSLAGKGILCPGFFFGAGIFSYGDFSKRGFIYMVSIVEKKLGKCYINSKRFY